MPKTTFAFSTNEVTLAIRNAHELALRVQQALAADAPEDERARIGEIVAALQNVRKAAQDIHCPNPFYGFYTVDMDKLVKPDDPGQS